MSTFHKVTKEELFSHCDNYAEMITKRLVSSSDKYINVITNLITSTATYEVYYQKKLVAKCDNITNALYYYNNIDDKDVITIRKTI